MSEKTRAGRHNGFERTFSVGVDPQAVWEAITRPPSDGSDAGLYHLPGFEAKCSELEVDPGRLLRLRKEEEPCKGTEIVIQLEHAGSGTRITVVQSGFGPWLPDVLETFSHVWNMIVADLKLYIETGISVKTHLFSDPAPTVSLGCSVADNLSGLRVTRVEESGFSARAGIQPGDLLLKLNNVRLLHNPQLMDLMRVCNTGDVLEVEWARGRERLRAAAHL